MKTPEKLTLAAEITTAVAVVISLLYVGKQISQNTLSVMSNTNQSTYELYFEFKNILVSNPEFADLAERIYASSEAISASDSTRWTEYLGLELNVYESVAANLEFGTIEDEMAAAWLMNLSEWVCQPFAQSFWTAYGETYVSELRNRVNLLYSDPNLCT